MRVLAVILCLLAAGLLQAETLITKAKIAEVTERGYILTIGTEALPVEDESSTRFWKDGKPAKRADFVAGDPVTVRLKTDGDPVVVREMSDPTTYDWLTGLREDISSGTVSKVDTKYVTIRLDSGGEFPFRYSEKTKVEIGGSPVAVSDLKEGQRIFIKGRLLPTLDTWIAEASDARLISKTKTSKKGEKEAKPVQLASTGVLRGVVDLHQPLYHMVDFYVGPRLMHTIYNARTIFKIDGRKADPSWIEHGLRIAVTYLRDQYGRLVASKIELSHASS